MANKREEQTVTNSTSTCKIKRISLQKSDFFSKDKQAA